MAPALRVIAIKAAFVTAPLSVYAPVSVVPVAFGPGRLAVLQPVAEAGRIAPGDIEDRTVDALAVTARDRVAVAARTAALGDADRRQ